MFVFVGGVQPSVESKTVDLECPLCHRSSTQEKTINQVLSLFFVPLFTVHKGEPYRVCPSCGWDSRREDGWQLLSRDCSDASSPRSSTTSPHAELGGTTAPSAPQMPLSCSHCGNVVQQNYLFCPFCGTFLKE